MIGPVKAVEDQGKIFGVDSPAVITDSDVKNMTLTGLSISLGRPLYRDITGYLKFDFEKNLIRDFWADGTDHSQPSLTIESPVHPLEFWDNSVEVGVVKNKLNYQDRDFVNGGYQLSAHCSVAGEYIGGEYNYQKLVLEGKRFFPLAENLVFGTRLQGGILSGDYPDYDALYIGGIYKLRGFDTRRFYDSETRKLIGDEYLFANNELRYRLNSNKNLEFVLFYDIGQMTDGGNHSLKWDYGVGFRYNMPLLGVLRFDQAWNSDGKTQFVFSILEMF